MDWVLIALEVDPVFSPLTGCGEKLNIIAYWTIRWRGLIVIVGLWVVSVVSWGVAMGRGGEDILTGSCGALT